MFSFRPRYSTWCLTLEGRQPESHAGGLASPRSGRGLLEAVWGLRSGSLALVLENQFCGVGPGFWEEEPVLVLWPVTSRVGPGVWGLC